MAKGRIGLDVGSTAVRAAELVGGATPTVVRAAQVPLPAGAVENGEVRDPGAVAEALRQLWTNGGFKSRQVWLGVGNQRVVVREIAIPWLPEKELRASLGFQVQEFIPMPVDEAVLDFDPLGEFEQDDRRMFRMLLVAAQRAMVDGLVQAAQGAKLEPVRQRRAVPRKWVHPAPGRRRTPRSRPHRAGRRGVPWSRSRGAQSRSCPKVGLPPCQLVCHDLGHAAPLA